MQLSIFIFYLIFFSFLITIIPFFKTSGIGRYLLITLFFIKVFVGIAYAKFYTLPKYYSGSDTWRFFRLSLVETKWMLHNPSAFVKDLFTYSYNKSGNLFSGQNSYWNDLKSNVIIKLMAIINIFTNNSYYSNIIFFNFLFLFGLVALFRLFYQIFPEKKWVIITSVFLLPSALFWCSGIHKDGLILSAAGLTVYTFYKGFKSKFTAGKVLILLFCMLVLFSLRNYVFFALFPPLLAWALCEKYSGKNILIFAAIYTTAIVFLIIIYLIFPTINILSFVTNKQHEFLLLEGGSKVNLPRLEPALKSFIAFVPSALDMAFLRPHFSEAKNLSYLPSVIENVLLLVLFVVSIVYANIKIVLEPVILFLIFFTFSIMLLSGYTVPFTGAIVRYKSFVLPLLITPLLCFFPSFTKKKSQNFRIQYD